MEMVPATQFVLGAGQAGPASQRRPAAGRLADLARSQGAVRDSSPGQADIRANSQSALAQEIKAAGSKVIYEDVETMNQRAEYYRKLVSIVRGQG